MAETSQSLAREFYIHFQSKHAELVARIDSHSSSAATSDALDQLSADIVTLRKELTDATGFLPSYDQRQCELKVRDLEAQVEKLRASAAPKAKFAFKRKPKTAPTVPTAASSAPTSSHSSSLGTTQQAAPGLVISGRSQEFLGLSSLSLGQNQVSSDLTLSDIERCIVCLLPSDRSDATTSTSPSTLKITSLHVRNVRNSVLILPKIEGSALLHDVSLSVIVLGCHQYRMHTSSKVDVYISASSNPIIEHCSGIRFAGYPRSLHQRAGAEENDQTNNYLAVQDFSHIRPTPSPNWSLMQQEEMVADSDWPVDHVELAFLFAVAFKAG
ncbi:hypothetical protein WOLCODRAFT_134530 [Wolfiporia cocos MD-104 SS10]|uniref:C-CAP/cofactor C-like domain-containing protein n=1 Tax=Wolfiporia cocos (strain MD-104) TaxID=742152 RepID=A0A2H3J5B2_WOLCO|nr:hypothetical protein WOLCODRAFT_134530 [Wolfiporia cocos MD-104 SS10]